MANLVCWTYLGEASPLVSFAVLWPYHATWFWRHYLGEPRYVGVSVSLSTGLSWRSIICCTVAIPCYLILKALFRRTKVCPHVRQSVTDSVTVVDIFSIHNELWTQQILVKFTIARPTNIYIRFRWPVSSAHRKCPRWICCFIENLLLWICYNDTLLY